MNPLIQTGLDWQRGHCALSVNVNRVALLRNSRPLDIPNVVDAARWALEAGAHGITVHPRPDQRHIRSADVLAIGTLLVDWPQAEFNIEGNPFHNLMPLVEEAVRRGVRVHQVTFVPDEEGQATSDHGWSLAQDGERLQPLIAKAKTFGSRVSLFMDPEPSAMPAAAELGANRVELYTEAYALAHGTPSQDEVLGGFAQAADAALRSGLEVNAGHDLNRQNLAEFLRAVPGVREVSIGHALIADCIEMGMAAAVQSYVRVIGSAAL